ISAGTPFLRIMSPAIVSRTPFSCVATPSGGSCCSPQWGNRRRPFGRPVPIRCRTCGTGEESVRSAHFLNTWLYLYFPIVMGLLKTAEGSLPPRHDFAVRFGTVLMGSPSLLPVAGGRRKREEPAIDPAAVAVRSRKKARTLG